MNSKDMCPYQRIEYLEVNEEGGKAWIETDFIPGNIPFDIFCTFQFFGYSNSDKYISWFGSYDTNDSHYRTGISLAFNNSDVVLINGDYTRSPRIAPSVGLKQDIVLKANGERKFNNIEFTTNAFQDYLLPCNNPFTIFILEPETNYNLGYVFGKLYSMRLEREGKAIMDLIPVRKDGEGYLYDRVSGKMYGNVGREGSRFILGPDIN